MPRPVLLLVALAATACGGGGRPTPATSTLPPPTITTAEVPGDDRPPGNPAVHDRIAGLTDCFALQDELTSAVATAELHEPGDVLRDVAIAYATTAADRMDAVGC